jgi:PAS domain S-box-containing protein
MIDTVRAEDIERGEAVRTGAGTRRLSLLVALVAVVLIVETGPALLGLDNTQLRWWANGSLLLLTLSAAVACGLAARASSGSDAVAWRWIAGGNIAWLAGMLIWSYQELIVGRITPFPALSDVFWLISPLLFMLGMLRYRSGRVDQGDLLLQATNLAIVLCTLTVVMTTVLHAPLAESSEQGRLGLYQYTALAWPVLYGAAFVFGLICLAFRTRGPRSLVFLLLLVSMALHAVVSLPYAQALLYSSYEIGADTDLLWILALAFACWSAFEQIEFARAVQSGGGKPLNEALRALENLLPAASFLAWVVADLSHHGVSGGVESNAINIGVAGLVLFCGLRGWLAVRVEGGLRKIAEEAADRVAGSEARLRSVFDHSRDAILLIAEDGRILRANEGAAELFGQARDDLVGRPIGSLIAEGLPPAEAVQFEFAVRRPDAAVRVAEMSQAGFRSDGGEALRSLVIRDVTWRKATEAALAAQTALLRATIDSIDQGVAVFGADQRLAIANDAFARVMALPPQLSRPGTPLREIARFEALRGDFGPGDADALVAAHLAPAGHATNVAYRELPGGRTVEVRSRPMLDGGFVATHDDISERRRIEQMKTEFVSTVSHELRTPLTSMAGSLGLVIGGAMGEIPDRVRPLLEIANNNCQRLQRLINDILDIEKIESGEMDFRPRPIALALLIDQAVEANQAYVAGCGARIASANAPHDVTVTGDLDRLLQVMANLLSNAAKFSPEGGTVTIGTSARDGLVRITVADQGPGIPDSFRSRIFGRFAQADSSDERKRGGTGLGLSISKAIIERHGGRIGFENGKDAGTIFFVDLPLTVGNHGGPAGSRLPGFPVTPDLETESSSATAHPLARRRILHVEDDLDNQHVVSVALREVATVLCVGSVATATARLQQEAFDLVLLDLRLPDGVGTDLLPIMDRRAGPRVPVVIFSAFDVPQNFTSRVNASLVKSKTSTEQLCAVIGGLLGLAPPPILVAPR